MTKSIFNSKFSLLVIIAMFAMSAFDLKAQQLEPILPAPGTEFSGPQLPPNFNNQTDVAQPQPPSQPRGPRYRLKDITFPANERHNNVDGVSLVVGLSQTGSSSEQTLTMARNFFERQGISVQTPATASMAAVQVSGAIPAYARKGEKIRVNVSVMDDSTSLYGGVLLRTPLYGIDGQIYAIAEGQLTASGIAAGGQAANVQVDHPTVGQCTATIEREICADFPETGRVKLLLRNKENSTAVSVANALNNIFPRSSRAIDQGAVEVLVPRSFHGRRTDFLSVIGTLEVPVDPSAKVVINQKTGTIILGQNVRISPVFYSKGSLVISTTELPAVSQPAPFSNGETVVVPRTDLQVTESGGPAGRIGGGTTVGDLGRALSQLGFTPNAMIELFTSLKTGGYLQAELIIE